MEHGPIVGSIKFSNAMCIRLFVRYMLIFSNCFSYCVISGGLAILPSYHGTEVLDRTKNACGFLLMASLWDIPSYCNFNVYGMFKT